ncbi:hypothetical protein HAX54_023246 [Datura stramonium]|uniref:Putative plant transposon protein domain-containing protein n=1 Tax=Datura stramonium TaxID=4076 RepID=A0ABS8UYH0_DATST|nr:hypothetical protein [Datura stramonium]
MSVSPHSHKSQASVHTSNTQVRLGLEGMEEYYSSFKEKRVIHAEAQFDVSSFKIACSDIYYQIGTCNWGPFTILVDQYFPELVWEFYASYRARQQLLKHKGRTEAFVCLTSVWVRGKKVSVTPEAINSLYWGEPIPSHPIFRNKVENKAYQFQWVANLIANGRPQWAISKGLIHWHDLKFEACIWLDLVCARLIPSRNTLKVLIEVAILLTCIMDHVHINVGEIIANQLKRRAKQQATTLPFPNPVSMLCMRVVCPLFRPLDRTVQTNNMITLATKTEKRGSSYEAGKVYREQDPGTTFGIHSHISCPAPYR